MAVDTEMDEDDEPPLGPDGDLNTQMVNDAVVPLLTEAFKHGAYDPYSAKQTRKAVDVLEVVHHLAGKDSRKSIVSAPLPFVPLFHCLAASISNSSCRTF